MMSVIDHSCMSHPYLCRNPFKSFRDEDDTTVDVDERVEMKWSISSLVKKSKKSSMVGASFPESLKSIIAASHWFADFSS